VYFPMGEDNNKNVDPVPYFIHEGVVSRMAECNKKLLVALIVAVLALFLNNIVWIVYEGVAHSQPKEVVSYEETDS